MGALPLYREGVELPVVPRGAHLRLVQDTAGVRPSGRPAAMSGMGLRGLTGAPVRRRVSPEVRRRRMLLALAATVLIVLALPWGGHTALPNGGSPDAPLAAARTHPISYRVAPGDTLWSIAAQVDPSADPAPLVTAMAQEIGSEQVSPGEVLTVP